MARSYLAIPAIFDSFESIFSIEKNIITNRRNKMLPNMFRWIMLLKSWDVIEDIGDLLDEEITSSR